MNLVLIRDQINLTIVFGMDFQLKLVDPDLKLGTVLNLRVVSEINDLLISQISSINSVKLSLLFCLSVHLNIL